MLVLLKKWPRYSDLQTHFQADSCEPEAPTKEILWDLCQLRTQQVLSWQSEFFISVAGDVITGWKITCVVQVVITERIPCTKHSTGYYCTDTAGPLQCAFFKFGCWWWSQKLPGGNSKCSYKLFSFDTPLGVTKHQDVTNTKRGRSY